MADGRWPSRTVAIAGLTAPVGAERPQLCLDRSVVGEAPAGTTQRGQGALVLCSPLPYALALWLLSGASALARPSSPTPAAISLRRTRSIPSAKRASADSG
jgi:hypothetical protein